MKRALIFILGIAVAAIALASSLPYTFKSGQSALAHEVNENFDFVYKKASWELIVKEVSAQGDDDDLVPSPHISFTGVGCPVRTTPISASCACDSGEFGTRNRGTLESCETTSYGGFVVCHSGTQDEPRDVWLPVPIAKITVRCMGVRDHEGDMSRIPVLVDGVESKPGRSLDDELNERLNQMRQEIAEHE